MLHALVAIGSGYDDRYLSKIMPTAYLLDGPEPILSRETQVHDNQIQLLSELLGQFDPTLGCPCPARNVATQTLEMHPHGSSYHEFIFYQKHKRHRTAPAARIKPAIPVELGCI